MTIRPFAAALLAGIGAASAWAASAQAPAAERVRIDGAFEIDRTEVSIARFRAHAERSKLQTAAQREGGGFEYDGGWERRAGWNFLAPQGQAGADGEPAVHVTWSEARDHCRAAGGRLPTLAEWQRAAYTETRQQPSDGFVRGRTYRYPVGDRPEGMNNNRRHHLPVGSTTRGVNGLHEMGANVWEWLEDRRGDTALTAGGSWWYGPEQSQAGSAQWKAADFHAVYIGWRCAYDLRG